jgi:tripartite-type tricarboxylate transporter receptor subunit TctC
LLWAVLTVCATLTAQLPILGFAQPYPSRPIRLVHGFATGGPIDVFSRPIAQKLTESFKLQVVVDSRPGATGTIANELVARSAPDGYTLLAAPSSAMTAAPHLFKLSYNPIDDFAPVIQIGEFPFVLAAHPAVPIKTARDLIALAKAKPGILTYGSAGIGSAFHLAGELFSKTAGVKLLHVPYRGGGTTAHTDLVGGRLDLMWDSVGIMLPYVQAGRLRAIGVTGAHPSAALPGVPAVAESGLPGYAIGGWLGVFAPAATPKEIIGVLNTAIAKILASADIKDLWKTLAMDIAPSTPEQFAARMRFDYDRYGKLIQSTGVKIEP